MYVIKICRCQAIFYRYYIVNIENYESGDCMFIKDLQKVLTRYQSVMLIDERNVCVYTGRAEDIDKILLEHKVENITGSAENTTLIIRCAS